MVVGIPQPAAAAVVTGVRVNAAEARMIRLVNAARVQAGMPTLVLAPGYTDVARRWSRAMSARHTLGHNPRLAANLSVAGGRTWRAVGENVAFGYSAGVIFGMYMRSPRHRANILDRSYRYVGIGWVEAGSGRGYTTLVFSNTYSAGYGPSRTVPARCTSHR